MSEKKYKVDSKMLKKLSDKAECVFIHVAFLKGYVEINKTEVVRLAIENHDRNWFVNFVPVSNGLLFIWDHEKL